jgi:hypothetical protein
MKTSKRYTLIAIFSVLLTACVFYSSFMAYELLMRFLSSSENATVIALFGSCIIAIAIVATGLLGEKTTRFNASLVLALFTVAYEFSAYFSALQEKDFVFDAIMPAVLLSLVIPFATHYASEKLSHLIWGDEELPEANELPLVVADAAPLLKQEKVQCANPKCSNSFVPNRGRKTCSDSCRVQLSQLRKKEKNNKE